MMERNYEVAAQTQNNGYAHHGALLGAAEQRRLEVPAEMDRMSMLLKGLEQGISHLESRLSESVLRAPGNQIARGDPVPAPAAPSCTTVGSRLQEANSMLNALGDRVQGIIARLEA